MIMKTNAIYLLFAMILFFVIFSGSYWLKCFLLIDVIKHHHLSGYPYFHWLYMTAMKTRGVL